MDSPWKQNIVDSTSNDNVNIMYLPEKDNVNIQITRKNNDASFHMDSTDFSNYNEIFSFYTNSTYLCKYSNYIWQFWKSYKENDCYSLKLACSGVFQSFWICF